MVNPLRFLFPFVVVGLVWQTMALSGLFPERLFPNLQTIAAALLRLVESGIVFVHAYQTLLRLLLGTLLGATLGILMGLLMGTNKRVEDLLSPWVSIFAPIPGVGLCPAFHALVWAWQRFNNSPSRLRNFFPNCFKYLGWREGC